MNTPPTPKKPKSVRVTVPVTSEVLEAFQTLADASGTSTGKAMGQFLEDMIDSVQYLAQKMQQARNAPKTVARELHAYALGLADETGQLIHDMTLKGRADRAAAGTGNRHADRLGGTAPPSSNTGGKVPRVNPNPRGSKSPMPPARVQAYADNNGYPPAGLKQ